jgi:YD repeat-containing protein
VSKEINTEKGLTKNHVAMKKIIFLIIILFTYIKVFAQDFYNREGVIPPNPIAASFKLYGDIPVSYSTGVPDISIPLYTIQVGDFSLPIELKYHIRSVKPGSCRSNVALGWSLHFGGFVSRTVHGKPDENSDFYTYKTGIGNGNDYLLKDLYDRDNYFDSEKDIFSYDINGTFGEFILSDPYLQPHRLSGHPDTIVVESGVLYPYDGIDNINITNDKGEIFKFGYGKKEHALFGESGVAVNTTWNLTQIALPTNQTIDFKSADIVAYESKYIQHMSIKDAQNVQSASLSDCGDLITICDAPYIGPVNYVSNYRVVYEKNIDTISFPNGRIIFILSADNRIIDSVKIYEGSRLLKTYAFILDNTKSMGDMKLLREIVESDSLNPISEYHFEYYNEGSVGTNANTDYWGYYNGISANYIPYNIYHAYSGGNEPNCPEQSQTKTFYGGQSKEFSLSALKTNVLKKIIYPTKGYVEFDYGVNVMKGVGAEKEGNGLRVEQIQENDNNGHTIMRTFEYTPYTNLDYYFEGINDFATTAFYVGKYDVVNNESHYTGVGRYRIIDYSGIAPDRSMDLMDVQYSTVTEYIGNNTGNNIGKNVYYYNYYNNHEFTDNAPMHPTYLQFIGSSFYIISYKGWDNGQLERKDVFDKNDTPIMSTEYDYNYHYDDTIQNTHVTKLCYYPGEDGDDSTRRECLQYQLGSGLPPIYGYYNYNIVSGWMEKTSEAETHYFNGTPVTKTISYEYNGKEKYYPSDITQNNSDGSMALITKKYPYDIPVSPFTTMVSQNIISPAIVKKEFHNNNFLRADSTAYSVWHSSFFKPLAEYSRTVGQSGYERRLNYNDYDDKGNILSISKEDDIKNVYIWGYNQTYPVVKITGIAYNDIQSSIKTNISGRTYTSSSTYSDVKVDVDYLKGQLSTLMADASYMVTIYTYKPLVGMTSRTDQNGITTYYEYDKIGRLINIRDNDGHILKTYEYHYKSQSEN